jgi:phosphoadenosine phosphosulfate reductase
MGKDVGGVKAHLSLHDKVDVALELIEEQIKTAAQPCITSSFQTSGVVLLHLVRNLAPRMPVLFLDTGYHFPEVYAYRDKVTRSWGLNLVNLYPEQTVAQQEADLGLLYIVAPDQCCAARKVAPLFRALEQYDLWFSGLRREQSQTRSDLQTVDSFTLPSGHRLRKVSPLAHWSSDDLSAYVAEHRIPLLPLYEQGYTSIGCQPCTKPPADSGDLRSGRWNGQKLECGIHIQAKPDEGSARGGPLSS